MRRYIGLGSALALGFVLFVFGTVAPRPAPADAPARAFSAGRAFADVKAIARVPHPVASPANAAVRDYLVGRFTAMGMPTRIQGGVTFEQAKWDPSAISGASVENIVSVIPGRDPNAPAVAVMAHYDSVPGSPGAADDAAGAAAALEIARALKTGGQPARDVIFLITDGEEQGLLGARAFFEGDPAAAHIGMVVNMEARGGGGRANMFQTGPDNGALIRAFAGKAKDPISSSLAVFLYERMPNDTDFTVSKAKGISGLNFAFIGRQFDYHSPSSTPAALDQGALQSIGEQALAAVTTLAQGDQLPKPAPSLVYSQLFGSIVLAYPVWGGWLLWLATACLLGLAAWRAGKVERLRITEVAKGAGAALLMVVLTAALLYVARLGTGVGYGFMAQRPLLARFPIWEAALAFLALAGALAAAPAKAARAHWLGLLLTGLLASLILQVLAPTAAMIVSWPLFAAVVGAAVIGLASEQAGWRRATYVVIAGLALGWIGVYFHLMAQGLDLPASLALFAWLGAFVLWPLAGDRRPAVAALLLGAVLVGVLAFTSPWSARHPKASAIYYVVDEKAGRAFRATPSLRADPWSKSALGGAIQKGRYPPLSGGEMDYAAAPMVAHAAPDIGLAASPDGHVVLRAAGLPAGSSLALEVRSNVPLSRVEVAGRAIGKPPAPGQWMRLAWRPGPQGLTLDLHAVTHGVVEARWALNTGAWPADAVPLPKRPATLMPWGESDALVLIGSTKATW